MYLSKLILNTGNLNAWRALADPYAMHKLIWQGFPNIRRQDRNESSGILFRVEPFIQGSPVVILVQSVLEPDWTSLKPEGLLSDFAQKVYSLSIIPGQTLRFRLRANPTARRICKESKHTEDGRPLRKRVGLFGEDEYREWLKRKAEAGGFEILELRISSWGNIDSEKSKSEPKIRHLGVDFEGLLLVADTALFTKTLESGIGSAKGFGFGLLSIASA